MDFSKIGSLIMKESIPIVQNLIIGAVESRTMNKHAEIFEKKMNRSVEILDIAESKSNHIHTPGGSGEAGPKLSTGVKKGETKESLGNRKWKEYEDHLEKLPDSATQSQVQKALQQIQDNISKSYPCEDCRIHAIENLNEFPLNDKSVSSKDDGKARLCTFHNIVNEQLGKPITVTCSPLSQ